MSKQADKPPIYHPTPDTLIGTAGEAIKAGDVVIIDKDGYIRRARHD